MARERLLEHFFGHSQAAKISGCQVWMPAPAVRSNIAPWVLDAAGNTLSGYQLDAFALRGCPPHATACGGLSEAGRQDKPARPQADNTLTRTKQAPAAETTLSQGHQKQ